VSGAISLELGDGERLLFNVGSVEGSCRSVGRGFAEALVEYC